MLMFNLKNTFRHHKGLLACMVVLSVCSVLVCDIGVFSFNSQRQTVLKYDKATEYSVIVNENFDEKYFFNKINSVIDKHGKGLESVYITLKEDTPIYVYYKGNDVFSSGDLPQNNSQIMIGAKSKSVGYGIGDTLNNSLGTFMVCGIRPMREYDELLPSAIPDGTMIYAVSFRWNYVLSGRKSVQFQKQLSEMFPQKKIITPISSDITEGLLLSLRSAIAISGIAVCNIMIVFSFLIKMKRDIYSVLYVCGSSKKRICISAAFELLVYIILGGTIGHIVFYLFFLNYQTAYEQFVLRGFLISYAISIVLCTVAVFPVLAKGVGDVTRQEEEYA